MRRIATVVLLLLLVLFGAYTALWFFIANRAADEVARWAARERQRGFDVSWDGLRVHGYPLAHRIEAGGVRFRDLISGRAIEARVPLIHATAFPWNFRSWAIDAPDGFAATAGPAGAPQATLAAQAISGRIVTDPEGGAAITLDLHDPVFEAGGRIAARTAMISIATPREPPRTHAEPALNLTFEAHDLQIPQAPPPFRGTLEGLALDLTVLGAIPDLPPRQAAAAWRDAGGTIEVEKLAARSGDLAVTGTGTLALDRELQPEVAFSGSVQGYDRLIAGLAEAGIVPQGGSMLARLGLSLLARPGQEGPPQIRTSFTIQNGEMTLGPLRLGRLPRIAWE